MVRIFENRRQGRSVALVILAAFLSLSAAASTAAEEARKVEIILDASGSMNGRLKGGETKTAAAKEAITRLVAQLSDDAVLALRAFGFQSPQQKKDCRDTRLLVGFLPLRDSRQKIIEESRRIKALGYTPITYVLTEAVKDFSVDLQGEKAIILVTDGKETCPGDPCALARSLAGENLKLVIHTVGFGVDEATKQQLECIAGATGGSYFAAEDAQQLVDMLGQAVAAAKGSVAEEKGFGLLEIRGADLRGHTVTRAETGEKVASLGHTQSTVRLPAGIYNVTVGKAVWKSVKVEAGKTTVLRPGFLVVERAALAGHKIVDPETGTEQGEVSATGNSAALMPGEYLVTFGRTFWSVAIAPGEKTVLKPALVSAPKAPIQGYKIRTAAGELAGEVSQTKSIEPLPPGRYTIDIGGKKIPFTLTEGETQRF